MTHNSFRNEAGFPLAPAGSTATSVATGPAPGLMVPRIGDEADLLPQSAAERLRDLRRQSDDHHALIWAAVEDTQTLRIEIEGHRARLRQLREPRGSGGFNLAEDDLRVIEEQRRLDLKLAELKRRDELSKERGGRSSTLKALIRDAEDWIRKIPAGTAIAMHASVDPELKRGEDLLTGIERCRRRDRELRADLSRARAAPWPSPIAKKKMRDRIEQLAESGAPRADCAIDHSEPISFPTQTHQVRIFNADPSAVGFVELPDVLGLFAWLHRDALIAALDRAIDEVADDENALDAEQRQQAGAQILDDLLAVQRQEAELVWKAQAGGATIMHRPDIDPRALLGVELIPAAPRPPREGEGEAGLIRHVGA
ncbi:hypothetical protein [Bradyrhizobium sp. BR 1432]|uniref:hypothetical protein n=1 Tax=Bradyrhizobium sp. BR 1432 TaxID=3447966 RepID=UPI003EE48A24